RPGANLGHPTRPFRRAPKRVRGRSGTVRAVPFHGWHSSRRKGSPTDRTGLVRLCLRGRAPHPGAHLCPEAFAALGGPGLAQVVKEEKRGQLEINSKGPRTTGSAANRPHWPCFVVSRYEECVRRQGDTHERRKATSHRPWRRRVFDGARQSCAR